ncbi:MAG: hypothetical protein JWP74_3231 [Marmoricola sp.]|nr:hypothetical protein [Marmoricola sp.]
MARFGQAALDRALRDRTLIRVGPRRYALPASDPSVPLAIAWGGIVSMRSAAAHHGWELRLFPDRPDVTFPRDRNLPRSARRMLVPHWSHLTSDDVVDGVTNKRRTLIDCMRMLPLEESVPIADSALRTGDVTPEELRQIAASMRGRGRARAMGVAAMATKLAKNAFESTLRALASTVPGLHCVPQMPIKVGPGRDNHPDLADVDLRLIIEAEGFEWHGKPEQLTNDCARYNRFVLLGWTVIRFSWSQVIFKPAYVLRVLQEAVAYARQHANVADGADVRAA